MTSYEIVRRAVEFDSPERIPICFPALGIDDRFGVGLQSAAGWEPLQDAIRFYGPTKSNGAMTTFFYDRTTGTVYHDRGYW